MNKPNILFIISHDTGRYLGTYGYKVATPEIDQLAKNGVKFNQYYCPAPQCSPSRASIMTGLYPHNNGMMGLAHKSFSIDGEKTTIPKELQKVGYETSLFGFSHETIGKESPGVVSSTYKLGYDHYQEVPGNHAPHVAEYVENFLEQRADDQSQKPFFLSVGFEETHRPFDSYEEEADDIEDVEVLPYLPDTENVRKDIALFNGSVKVFDKAVGRIIRKLKETGIDKNTIVILTTDHGVAFPRGKGTLKDAGLETLLIAYAPHLIDQGKEVDQLLCNVDMMPTILELAGAPTPKELDGKSFASLLTGSQEKVREDFFCEVTWHDKYHPMRGIRTEKYKYVLNMEDGPKIYMPVDIHKSLSGQVVREEYYVPNDQEELYDMEKDRLEETNLINDPEYSQIASELRAKVRTWMEETNDPILSGPIPGVESSQWAQEAAKGLTYRSLARPE